MILLFNSKDVYNLSFLFKQGRMKVIKQLKQQTPSAKLQKFFKQTPLLTRLIVPLMIIGSTAVHLLSVTQQQYTFFSIIIVYSFSQILVFSVMAISDVRRQQYKGSIYFLINFILSSILLFTVNLANLRFIPQKVSELDLSFQRTSIPIQYLLLIGFIDAFQNPNGKKYLFCQPFYLKSLAYPIVISIILEIISIRIDILIPLVLAIIFHYLPILTGIRVISIKIDTFVGQNAQRMMFIRTGNPEANSVNVDHLATSNSIVLQQK